MLDLEKNSVNPTVERSVKDVQKRSKNMVQDAKVEIFKRKYPKRFCSLFVRVVKRGVMLVGAGDYPLRNPWSGGTVRELARWMRVAIASPEYDCLDVSGPAKGDLQ